MSSIFAYITNSDVGEAWFLNYSGTGSWLRSSELTIESGPFIADLHMKIVIFYSYVNLPEGGS